MFRVPVQASPDSAARLARYALGAVKGAIQPHRIQREVLLVSTQYTRQQRNTRYVQITIIAAVDRKMTEGPVPATMVELSAWAIDLPPQETALAGSRGSLPTLTTSTPYTMSSSQLQPYRITRKDVEDWAALEEVLNSLIDLTSR